MIGRILKALHVHYHTKPIMSRYVSFNTREIVYECRCGKRKAERVYRNYYDNVDFPMRTTLFCTTKDIKDCINGA